MSPRAHTRCLIAFASATRQYLWPLELPGEPTIAAALAACRALVGESVDGVPIPWDSAPLGVFGQRRERSARLAEGDRVELYRPLEADPRARRRERLARERRGAR